MTSGITNVINDVLTKLRAIPYRWSSQGVVYGGPDKSRPNHLFQLVRVWNDQVKREANAGSEGKGGYTFEKPACFVEMIPSESMQLTQNVTVTDYIFRLHIVDGQLDAGNEEDMDQNLTVMTYRDIANVYMVATNAPNCSTFFACDEKQDFDHGEVYHYIVDLKCCFTDTKGSALDPDQVQYIFKEPDTDAELVVGFQSPITDTPLTDPLTLEITPP